MANVGVHNSVLDTKQFVFEFSASSPRPGLFFAIGTVLVVLAILVATAIFLSCNELWAKLTKNAIAHEPVQLQPAPALRTSDHKSFIKLEPLPCLPVVYMPGDNVPTFIALPSSHATTVKQELMETKERKACGEAARVEFNVEIHF